MSEFSRAYARLNQQQREAVDRIDGPLLVLAGPGTGKTQLLSVRVANILDKTDTRSEEILCLTFTENAAHEMHRRLEQLIGRQAYQVNIDTFHGFGSRIMGRYPQYFYGSLAAINLSDLDRATIIQQILDKLPHSDPLASTINGQFKWSKALGELMGHIKQGGTDSNGLLELVAANDQDMEIIEPLLKGLFDHRMGKDTAEQAARLEKSLPPTSSDLLPRLIEAFRGDLRQALSEEGNQGLSQLKRSWLEGTMDKLKLRDRTANENLRALAGFFAHYQDHLASINRYDYDDMIMQVLLALDDHPDLLADLQEQYQYLLVDEFQDTNDAQLKLLLSLAEHPVNEGKPNLMVVGDDDQAIYKFQGATLNNMQTYLHRWPQSPIVSITDNYRSGQNLLDLARYVITQTKERVENDLRGISKELRAMLAKTNRIQAVELANESQEASFIAGDIARRNLKRQGDFSGIAVIARRHQQLEVIASALATLKIPVSYKRKENILNDPAIGNLLLLGETILSIAEERFDDSDAMLRQLLSHPMWGIEPLRLWDISLEAFHQNQPWLETLIDSSHQEIARTARGLVALATAANVESLDTMLDLMIGNQPVEASAALKERFVSPYRSYYFISDFSAGHLSIAELELIQRIRKLRDFIRDLSLSETPTLKTLIESIRQAKLADLAIMDDSQLISGQQAVSLHTAHSVKGLEFDEVYISGTIEERWNSSWGGNRPRLPHNITFIPAGDSLADKLRLFYVALTRSRKRLTLTAPLIIGDQKPATKLSFLVDSPLKWVASAMADTTQSSIELADRQEWFAPHLMILKKHSAVENLREMLSAWRLSATALNNFLDVTQGGPQHFFFSNVLRFPSAKQFATSYGTAAHDALTRAHLVYSTSGRILSAKQLLSLFAEAISRERLSANDRLKAIGRAEDQLLGFYKLYAKSMPDCQVNMSVRADYLGTRLSGKLDKVLTIDKKTMVVSDFKTSKPQRDWQGDSAYSRLRLHQYRQQLMFYKMLIESSPQSSGKKVQSGIIEYLQPDSVGQLAKLELEYSDQEMTDFKDLVKAVWHHITNLDFAGRQGRDLKDIKAFERELINEARKGSRW